MIDLGTTFLSSVDRCPQAIAITYENKHLNYSNWLNKISSLAISLKKMGLKYISFNKVNISSSQIRNI